MQRVAQLIFLQGRPLEKAHRFRGLTRDQEVDFNESSRRRRADQSPVQDTFVTLTV